MSKISSNYKDPNVGKSKFEHEMNKPDNQVIQPSQDGKMHELFKGFRCNSQQYKMYMATLQMQMMHLFKETMKHIANMKKAFQESEKA